MNRSTEGECRVAPTASWEKGVRCWHFQASETHLGALQPGRTGGKRRHTGKIIVTTIQANFG